jgi:hypothetical protein
MSTLVASTSVLLANDALLSSVTNCIKEYFLRSFPKNFFKYVYMRNSTFNVTEQNLTYEDRLIKPKPALAINLNFETQDATFSGDAFHFGMSHVRCYAYQQRHIYDNILVDEANQIFVSAFRTRTKHIYNIGIKVETELKASAINKYIEGFIGINRPFFIKDAIIEVPLPNNVLNRIVQYGSFPLTNDLDIAAFHAYLNKWSGGAITYKRNNSNGKWMYFYKYATNIFMRLPDKTSMQKVTEDKSVKEVIISFDAECEFGSHLNFITEHETFTNDNPSVPQGIVDNSDTTFLISNVNNEDVIVYNSTITQPLTRTLSDGKSLIHTLKIVTDTNTFSDITNFVQDFDPKLRLFFDYLNSKLSGTPTIFDDTLNVLVYRDSTLLDTSEYTIDWQGYTVTLNNPRLNYTYQLAFYIDLISFNSFIQAWQATADGQAKAEKLINI